MEIFKKQQWVKFIWINIGLIIMSIGLYFFLIPANLAVGGVAGLAMVIKHYCPVINLGILMWCFNIVLFVTAFFAIGKDFGKNSIYGSFALSGIIGVLEWLLPLKGPLGDDIFINLVFGILIQGIGMGIVFYCNASTGGTDIVAKIIHRYTDIPIGKALFLSDALITLAAGMAFGLTLGLYALLGILMNALIIDRVIEQMQDRKESLKITTTAELPLITNAQVLD